jgi:hypothetical protein
MKIYENYHCKRNKEKLLKYLLVKAAPVMLKVKPAMLVRLTNCNRAVELQRYDIFCIHQQDILKVLKLDYVIMKNNGADFQVLFYDRPELEKVLANKANQAFLSNFGYSSAWNAEQFLDELRKRFCGKEFPHEIGVFLGYPLKDVSGFIEKSPECVPVPNGMWRVFGSPNESLHLMWKYRFAEDIGRYVIKKYRNIEQSIDKLQTAILTEKQLII